MNFFLPLLPVLADLAGIGGWPPEPDLPPEPPRLMILGDSNSVGVFGRVFHDEVRKLGIFRVKQIAIGGASTRQFLKRDLRSIFTVKTTCCSSVVSESAPGDDKVRVVVRRNIGDHRPFGRFDRILRDFDPDVVLLFLGANRARIDHHKRLLERLNPDDERVVIWAGIYPRHNQQSLDADIQAALRDRDRFQNLFIASADIQGFKNPSKKSKHFNRRDSKIWALGLLDRMMPWLRDLAVIAPAPRDVDAGQRSSPRPANAPNL